MEMVPTRTGCPVACTSAILYDSLELGVQRSIYESSDLSGDGLIGRYHHYVHVIDLAEFLFFRLGRTCHTCQLIIHTEIILQSDGSQRL